jgi:hypothetical protein
MAGIRAAARICFGTFCQHFEIAASSTEYVGKTSRSKRLLGEKMF